MRDETQEAIVEAAFRAFGDFGYEKATTKRIAEYAGVNEVTIFRKFGNKAALMQEAVRREMEALQAHIRYTGDLEGDLAELVATYQALVRRRGRFLPTLFSEVLRRPEF
ncbi:MAG TPA: helix-turn-helix domain-containing protein, partial [Stenomitos sp.]